MDLDAKRVAVVKHSIQENALREHSLYLDIHPKFIFVDSFKEAFEKLQQGFVDASVVNNFYGNLNASSMGVYSTHILFNPVMVKFAFSKQLDGTYQEAIDRYIHNGKENPLSYFSYLKQRWLHESQNEPLPEWFYGAFWGVIVLIIVLVAFIFFFKKLLHVKIKELHENEKILIAQSRHAAMGEMMSMIAHQWKQPLAILSMVANNMKVDAELETLTPQSVHLYYDQLSKQIHYLSHTIDDFRNFFKPENKKQFVENLHRVIDQAAELIAPSLENVAITLHTSHTPIPPLFIYHNELIQVLLNLLKNAKDAFEQTPNKEATIWINSAYKEGYVVISIEDNAGGIDATLHQKIFEPYFTTKEQLNGTGLGLYMCKTIMEHHFKGHIDFTCKNAHTTFILSFPAKESHEPTS